MNAKRENQLRIRDLLSVHATWMYTDEAEDQIVCTCGWESSPFLPKTLERVGEMFGAHQTNVLIENRLI